MRIMNQLFDFRKIELNKLDIKVAESDIVSFTNALISYFSYQLNQKNITLKTLYNQDEIKLYFDPDKMDKIIYNLISNAIKNTPEGGEIVISITITNVKETRKKEEKFVEWKIHDNGKGIAEEKLTTIFNRFSYNSTAANQQEGTGIGLSIVKEFTEVHNGSINIDSRVDDNSGKGSYTEVTLLFPLTNNHYRSEQLLDNNQRAKDIIKENYAIGEINSSDKSHHEVIHTEPYLQEAVFTVLVIDDDKEVCDIIHNELSDQYKVYEAYNGKDGILKAKKHMPDVIISDIII